jgi:hypothetical protein
VLFALAFLVAAVFGEAPSITIGFSLGFGLAIASAVLLGEDCEDSFFLCITPTGAFFIGLVAALILCPGWALGARAGALKRRGTLHSSNSFGRRS